MLANMNFDNFSLERNTQTVSPEAEEFSYFYKFDEVSYHIANNGVDHALSEMPVVHVRDLVESRKNISARRG